MKISEKICANCGQFQHPPGGDCFNECKLRGVMPPEFGPDSMRPCEVCNGKFTPPPDYTGPGGMLCNNCAGECLEMALKLTEHFSTVLHDAARAIKQYRKEAADYSARIAARK